MNKLIFLLVFNLMCFHSISAQEVEFLNPKVIDLGEVLEGTEVQDKIIFVNTGTKPVQIKDVDPSCGCTVPQVPEEKYAPGDTAEISFTIDTEGFYGVERKSLTVSFKDNVLQDYKFYIQVGVFEEFEVTPRYIDFQNVKLNPDTVISWSIHMKNNTDNSIKIKKVYTDYNQIQIFPKSMDIPPHEKRSVSVELKPGRIDRKQTHIIIETDFESNPQIKKPVFIHIKDKK